MIYYAKNKNFDLMDFYICFEIWRVWDFCLLPASFYLLTQYSQELFTQFSAFGGQARQASQPRSVESAVDCVQFDAKWFDEKNIKDTMSKSEKWCRSP